MLISSFLFVFSGKLQAQNTDFTFGLKLAYQFGSNSGFVYGMELSISDNDGLPDAYIIDLDFCKQNIMLHLGYEMAVFYGIDIGPSFYLKDNKIYLGPTLNLFGGDVIYPFIGFNYFPSQNDFMFQTGTYIKYPFDFVKQFYRPK